MKLLLIDESKEKKFLLCVAEIDRQTAPAARKALNKSRMKSQADIHFISERPSRKKQILKNMSQIEFKVTNFSVEGLSENEARTKCLDALIDGLNPKLSYGLIIEQDDYKVQTDKKTIRDALIKKGMNLQVEYRHEKSRSECLLWIPDSIAWCSAKGGVWKKELEKFSIENLDVT